MFILLLNFLIITLSIILFVLPFMLWYSISRGVRPKRTEVSYYLENFFSSQQANWLIFSWAAGEAIVWFVIPEFLLLLIVFMRVRKKRQMLIYDIGGTLVGTAIALLMRLPESTIAKLPYIQEKMVSQTKIWYDEQGILGLVNQPFSGVPYKVFTHLGWQLQQSLLLFIVIAVIVRIFRYIIAYGLFISIYPRLHKLVRQNYIGLASVAIFIFSALLYKTYLHYQ
jgi:membrane protein YqaA with SNARE-associated domain